MRILALGAHADDVELGAGGSLSAWSRQGHEIHIHVATQSSYTSPEGQEVRDAVQAAQEAEKAAKRLKADLSFSPFSSFELAFAEPLNAALIRLFDIVRPDLLITHWEGDTHPDHQALAKAALHAARRVPSVLMFTSNWYQGTSTFDARHFIDISETLEDKLALISIYAGEDARTNGVWREWSRDRAASLGRLIGVRYAEAFQAVRYRMP